MDASGKHERTAASVRVRKVASRRPDVTGDRSDGAGGGTPAEPEDHAERIRKLEIRLSVLRMRQSTLPFEDREAGRRRIREVERELEALRAGEDSGTGDDSDKR
jgi:hypothetical protein